MIYYLTALICLASTVNSGICGVLSFHPSSWHRAKRSAPGVLLDTSLGSGPLRSRFEASPYLASDGEPKKRSLDAYAPPNEAPAINWDAPYVASNGAPKKRSADASYWGSPKPRAAPPSNADGRDTKGDLAVERGQPSKRSVPTFENANAPPPTGPVLSENPLGALFPSNTLFGGPVKSSPTSNINDLSPTSSINDLYALFGGAVKSPQPTSINDNSQPSSINEYLKLFGSNINPFTITSDVGDVPTQFLQQIQDTAAQLEFFTHFTHKQFEEGILAELKRLSDFFDQLTKLVQLHYDNTK